MMSESKKNSKIEPIFISDEMLEEDNFDSKLRDKMIEDAEEIEKALENDPKLDGIEVPAGMLDSITASLKNQGYWEDEEASEVSVGQKEELTEIDAAEDEDILEQQEIMRKAAGAEELSDDEIYQLLSPEDKAALTLGRRLKKRKRWQKIFIRSVCIVIFFGGAFIVSMTSDANRKYLIGLWNSVVGDELSIDISNIDSSKIESHSEMEARELIKRNLGVDTIQFGYYPEGFRYKDYEISIVGGWANIYYEYNECIFTVHMYKDILEGKRNQKFDGKILDTINITYSNNPVTIVEIENAVDEKAYVADFERDDIFYCIWGIMEKNEFEKLVTNVLF